MSVSQKCKITNAETIILFGRELHTHEAPSSTCRLRGLTATPTLRVSA